MWLSHLVFFRVVSRGCGKVSESTTTRDCYLNNRLLSDKRLHFPLYISRDQLRESCRWLCIRLTIKISLLHYNIYGNFVIFSLEYLIMTYTRVKPIQLLQFSWNYFRKSITKLLANIICRRSRSKNCVLFPFVVRSEIILPVIPFAIAFNWENVCSFNITIDSIKARSKQTYYRTSAEALSMWLLLSKTNKSGDRHSRPIGCLSKHSRGLLD